MEIYQDVEQIEINGQHIGDVKFKPTTPIYLMAVVAFALLFVPSIFARILAVFIGVVDSFVYFKVKDKLTIGVYTDCVLVYDNDGEKAYKINNSDIENYDTGLTQQYKVFIKLKNEQCIYKETYRMDQAQKYLKKALPKKTTAEVKKEKNKNIKLDPIKGFKRLFGIKK